MMRKVGNARGICRIENASKTADGWYVRLQRNGVAHSKFFKDSDYGNKKAALNAARRYYFHLVREHPKQSRREFAERKTSRNRSGIVGVNKVIKSRKGYDYEFWEARWSPKKGVVKVKVFSIAKFGAREAKRLAIEARKTGVAEMRD